jgi:hypothetical protein
MTWARGPHVGRRPYSIQGGVRMVTLELTTEEAEQLHFILTSYLTDLRGEIRETDVRSFRAQLQAREAFIRKLLQHLPTPAESSPT